jgi:hypothetical protein
MKAVVVVFCFVLICAIGTTPAAAQGKQKAVKTKPDFTGTWLLDPARRNVGPATTPDKPIKIAHHDPELRITHLVENNGQVSARDTVYYSDRRGETNPATIFLSTGADMNLPGHDKDVTNSRTAWSGNKLVTRSTLRSLIAGRQLEFEVIDEWKISADGKSLTQTSRTVFRQDTSDAVFVPANTPDIKRIYHRLPD